jgi:hypothetical protein
MAVHGREPRDEGPLCGPETARSTRCTPDAKVPVPALTGRDGDGRSPYAGYVGGKDRVARVAVPAVRRCRRRPSHRGKVGADVRAAVYGQVQDFSAREMNRFGTLSLITRNTNDVQQIQLFLKMALTIMVIAPIMCVGGLFMAVREGLWPRPAEPGPSALAPAAASSNARCMTYMACREEVGHVRTRGRRADRQGASSGR